EGTPDDAPSQFDYIHDNWSSAYGYRNGSADGYCFWYPPLRSDPLPSAPSPPEKSYLPDSRWVSRTDTEFRCYLSFSLDFPSLRSRASSSFCSFSSACVFGWIF